MKLAVFDFDGTMFPGNSMPYIWKQYGKKGYSKSRQLWALMKIQTDKFLCRKVFKDEVGWRYKATVHMFNLFVGMNDNEIREFFMLIRDEVISELNDEIVEKIQWHKDNGYEIVFLSGGFEVLLEMIGLHFGTARVKATPFVYGLDGRFMKVTAKDPLMTMNGNLKKSHTLRHSTQIKMWTGKPLMPMPIMKLMLR